MMKKSKNLSCPIQSICYPMIIARFLMINVIDQLFEHYNQNHSTSLIIGYLKLRVKKFQSSSRKVNDQ
ncbi:unnamed protein product [Rotaria sordida]|uniref:Uncharacterized protein n=1 Tax=Rotaria sordida TaxID=392033 RepID=A0A815B0B8_9BILA|nr:unnamed protein product [Rotaria sordida]